MRAWRDDSTGERRAQASRGNGGRRDRPAEEAGADGPDVASLLAMVAHDLRTPLTAIGGLAATLRRHRGQMAEVDVDAALDSLVRQCGALHALLESAIDVVRLGRGYHRPRSAVPVLDVVGQVLEAVPPPARTTVRVDGNGHAVRVWADDVALRRVVANLLTNAYRYGGSRVSVRVATDGASGTVEVVDDGPGLPEELRDAAFDPFVRAGSGTVTAGAGLGLALSRTLVEALDGTLTYEQAAPHGSTFRVSLPLAGQR